MDLKSIIYFFDNFKVDNNKEWKEKISRIYIKLSEMKLEDLKKNLKELKYNGIYDYEKPNKNYNLFTSLYEKKEAIDFLLSRINRDINALYEKIDLNNRAITIKDIKDTEKCIKIFNKFKELNNNFKIIEYIKTRLTEDEINNFEMFSQKYSFIIELDRNDDSLIKFYNQVNSYIQDGTFIFRQDNEYFSYGEKGITNIE